MAHFIPLKKDQKTAEYLVKIFAKEIWRFHGIPTDIISDRNSRFTSTEWKQFLGICYGGEGTAGTSITRGLSS
jgi:hypothetical protein